MRINKVYLAMALAILFVFVITIVAWYIPRAPNSDAEGFVVAVENSGGTSAYSEIYFIDDDGIGYYILLFKEGNYTFENIPESDSPYSFRTDSFFQVGDKYFYYNSTMNFTANISDIQAIINITNFYEHDWDWEQHMYSGYAIEEVKVVQLTSEDISMIIDNSREQSFRWLKHSYEPFLQSGPGEGPIEITMPSCHKSVIAWGSTRPEVFEEIQSSVESVFG